MPKSPENFDFSKQEDQERFDKLPGQEKQQRIEKAHEEALGVNEKVKQLEQLGLNREEAEIAQDALMKNASLETAVEHGKTESRLNFIRRLSKKETTEISDTEKKELEAATEYLSKVATGYLDFADEVHSSAEASFENMSGFLRELEREQVPKENLELIANNVVYSFLKKERMRKPGTGGLGRWGRPQSPYENPYRTNCNVRDAGNLMRDLGFYERALSLYRSVLRAGEEGQTPEIGKNMRALFKACRKSGELSGEKMEKAEKAMIEQVLEDATGSIRRGIKDAMEIYPSSTFYRSVWGGFRGTFKEVDEKLEEMGIDEAKRSQLSEDLRNKTIIQLVAMHKNNPRVREKSSETILDLYKKSGNKEKIDEWELKHLKAKAESLQKTIDFHVLVLKDDKRRMAEEDPNPRTPPVEESEKRIKEEKEELKRIEKKISEMESKEQ